LIIGKKLVHLPATDSTSDEARRLIKKGEGEGLAVLSDRQTRGRGKPGSAWFSPPGNLYLSVVIKPRKNAGELAAVTLFSALAVRALIVKLTQLPAVIKWPNDLRLNGKKTAGILTERLASGHVIIGIGLNLNSGRRDWPAELRRTATSLRIETAKQYSPGTCAALLCSLLDAEYRAFLEQNEG
jgi:BirA family biotin operon repressor/biotin-[acetyl-CoA-carboxylase] ligase